LKEDSRFFHSDVAGGIILLLAAALAMLAANTSLNSSYENFVGPSLFWINDFLMVFFFVLAGLEIKREICVGTLSNRARAMLPVLAAAGGMIAPALIYIGLNHATPQYRHGWAIPSATDIAFALGVLALVASRLPPAIKVLLTAIAVIDDLGAIIVIAVFYTDHIALGALGLAALCAIALFCLNRFRVTVYGPYFVIGLLLWAAMLKGGIHPTLAGVIIAFAIPTSALDSLQEKLHPWVVFLILPLFGFANAGVSFAGLHVSDLLHPVTIGIALGLFVGKQIGIFGSVYVLTKTRVCELAQGVTWPQIYGMSLLCGIGFTMALFVGGLAFTDPAMAAYVRMGVIGGSCLSAVCGCGVLYGTSRSAKG